MTDEIINSQKNNKIERVNYIPLIIYEKYIEITDIGIEYLKSFNNKVMNYKNYFIYYIFYS
jgi:hypothetical protein